MAREIVVVTGAWNLIGEVAETTYGLEVTNAEVIRVWGTTRGLGQIALDGSTEQTILDASGVVRIPHHAVILRILCVA